MTTASALPPTLGLDDWDALSGTDERLELVAGYVTVVPSETWRNVEAQSLFIERVRDATGRRHRCGSRMDVLLSELPPTVREPDVVVLRQDVRGDARRLNASDLVLVAEVVSPSSVETDWITKRREYAAAGIPVYVVIDVRDGHRRITAFGRPGPEGYADVRGGGRIGLDLDGHRVEVGVDDLVTEPGR